MYTHHTLLVFSRYFFNLLLAQMTSIAKAITVGLFVMSVYSIAVLINRLMAFSAARKQSRQFAPAVADALREGRLEEAVKIAERYKKSHLAKVVAAGLQEFRAHQISIETPGEEIDASRRALGHTEALVRAELKRGLSGLAIIGAAAPFAGLVGTAVQIINSFKSISYGKAPGVGSVAGGILEALITAAVGLFVAIPAVWMFTHLIRKVDVFDSEMSNSSNELLEQLLEHSQRRRNTGPHPSIV
jgi:biopolymer transport protein ExbB/TolQ